MVISVEGGCEADGCPCALRAGMQGRMEDEVKVNGKHYRTVWYEEGVVKMIDQPKLPFHFEIRACATCAETAEAIEEMRVRGAGAIGATAGFGMAQGVREARCDEDMGAGVRRAEALLRATRPTAQNLFFALRRVVDAAMPWIERDERDEAVEAAEREAARIADGDAEACRRIGEHGADLIVDGARISTHCNAGWLAFVDWGSALSPLYAAARRGRRFSVWVDETRPRRQGASLTAWELGQEGIPHRLVTDGVSASLMMRGEVSLVIVGSDRIAANGDVANKIGTYPLALAAREAGVPFYVAAPSSTIDEDCPCGASIPIEERSPDEVLFVEGLDEGGRWARVRIAPEETTAFNPAFDVTPASLVSGLITEFGIVAATPREIEKIVARRDAELAHPSFNA